MMSMQGVIIFAIAIFSALVFGKSKNDDVKYISFLIMTATIIIGVNIL